MKYAWIDQNAKHFELHELCCVLEVSISGYRSWKRGGSPERKRLTDAQMLALIQAIHAELRGAYPTLKSHHSPPINHYRPHRLRQH